MANTVVHVQKINNPVLRGKPLLLLPEGLLVRWPDRVPMPEVGATFQGTAVTVPAHLREVVMALLFGASPLARCDAARRLAQNKQHRRRILSQIFSRSYVQQAVASAERIEPAMRKELEAMGGVVPLRQVFRVACSPTSRGRRKN